MMVKRLLKSFHPVVQNAVFLGSGQICWSLSDFCGVELGIRKAGDSRELRHPARHSPAILFIFSAKLFAQRRLLVKHNKKMEEQPETRICCESRWASHAKQLPQPSSKFDFSRMTV